MATFDDNIKTIETAVYGKEMRPAISEALTQSRDAVKIMMGAVNQLNARIDNLPSGGGGTVDPDNPDIPPQNYSPVYIFKVTPVVDGIISNTYGIGEATII